MSKVLVLAVHPDDETLGCGGTLLRHKSQGDAVHWLIATTMKKEHGFRKEDIARREEEIVHVAGLYGFDGTCRLDIPATAADTAPAGPIIKDISGILNDLRPDTVYLPFRGDVHTDHRVMFEAAWSSLKTFRRPFVRRVLMMETLSETDFSPAFPDAVFVPNYFVDITDFLERKIGIMAAFKGETAAPPFPRSTENIRALAALRGAASGCMAAEAFMLMKEIW